MRRSKARFHRKRSRTCPNLIVTRTNFCVFAPGVFGDGARLANGNSAGFPNGPGGNNGSGGTGGSNDAIFQSENQQPISANGQRITANSYTVDGVGVNSLTWGGAAVLTPSADSVQEITVVSSDYDASDGRNSGAHVKVVTKSGTNDFHGSGFFQYENPGFNAFNKYNGFDTSSNTITTARNDDAFRQFGASLGGPIIKNKLFFFFNYEALRDKDTTFQDQWVETPQFDQALIAARPNTPVSQPSLQPASRLASNRFCRRIAVCGLRQMNRVRSSMVVSTSALPAEPTDNNLQLRLHQHGVKSEPKLPWNC